MTPERWARIEQLFEGALQRDAATRSEWLEAACGGDAELRREVEALLAADSLAQSKLAGAVAASARALPHPPSLGSSQIGPYEVLDEIGRGGMGVVYLARRNDDVFRKAVAIKVVKRGMDTELVLGRFRHERRILARLDHPYIARILDGGSTADGLPYLVMEHVRGVRIDAYCNEHRLGLEARLQLFRKACAAVEYAHQNLIVHRDLKPSNILVDETGAPRLLDFGIAKLLEDSDEELTTLTAEGRQHFTPRYASPEQVMAEPITTASDIYSLGAILYELLTGNAAHDITGSTPAALIHAVCEKPIPPPSLAARAANPAPVPPRQLAGDLDNIVLTALRKDRRERYASVQQFEDDVRRYLDDLPVHARPQTLGYRARKFLRRRRTAVVSASLVMGSLVGGLSFSIYQQRRAERRFQQVRQLANSMLFGVDDRIRDLPGATEAREWVVHTAMEYLDNLSRDAGNDPTLLLELAQAYQRVGDVEGHGFMPNLGHREAARQSYGKALAIAQRLAATSSDPKVQRLLAISYERVGVTSDESRSAEPMYLRGIEVAERLYHADRSPPNADLLSTLQLELGQWVAAQDAVRASDAWTAALEVAQRWVADESSDEARTRLAYCYRWAARGRLTGGDPGGALQYGRESLRLREALLQSHPTNVALRRDLMNSYSELGNAYNSVDFLSLEDAQTAAAMHRLALAIADDLSRADPKNLTAVNDLALEHASLCRDLATIQPREALRHCQGALALTEQLDPDRSKDFPRDRGQPLALARLGRRREAVELLRSQIAAFKRTALEPAAAAQDRRNLLWAQRQLAALLVEMSNEREGVALYREAAELAESTSKAQPSDRSALYSLAEIYSALGRYHEGRDWSQARQWHRKSLAIWNAWPVSSAPERPTLTHRARAAEAVARCDAALGSVVQPHDAADGRGAGRPGVPSSIAALTRVSSVVHAAFASASNFGPATSSNVTSSASATVV